jgi:hypothetical protein
MAKGDPEEFEERAAIREYDGGFHARKRNGWLGWI